MAKKNQTIVTDEEIISALLQHVTIKDAAGAVGISERAIYDRMRDEDFQAYYTSARNEILRKAVKKISDYTSSAIDTVADIMKDKDAPASTRLQAATAILNYTGRYTGLLTRSERLAEEKGLAGFPLM